MGSTEQKIEEQFAQLQQKVGARHAEMLKHSDGDRFAVEYARLVELREDDPRASGRTRSQT
ncbi:MULTISPECIES: hypothetical protein [Streptomyces]|uniref:hypothetical protein n=1 Tax=Streptomyces TaxID=1883 RepID=UPI0007EDB7A6|nr:MULTISPECIES: hypothetical protein [unclassified Streptomyces]MCP3770135.1 hypothetical protein [Streptomyces sp. MAR25Y5]OBQ54351.1 hypothetical protein A4U61_00675 [Streptomyces sp. H-KF8]